MEIVGSRKNKHTSSVFPVSLQRHPVVRSLFLRNRSGSLDRVEMSIRVDRGRLRACSPVRNHQNCVVQLRILLQGVWQTFIPPEGWRESPGSSTRWLRSWVWESCLLRFLSLAVVANEANVSSTQVRRAQFGSVKSAVQASKTRLNKWKFLSVTKTTPS